MSKFKISSPGAGSAGFDKSAHIDHLLAFVGAVEEERHGRNGNYVAAHCAYAVCVPCRKGWTDTDVSGAALAPRILSADGEIVAGVLVQGDAKPGQSPPFLLENPSPEEFDMLDELFETYAVKMPTGKVIFDIDTYNATGQS
jgi:hypothetical protein